MKLTHPLVRELAWCCFSTDQLEPATLAAHGVHPFAPALDRHRRRWLAELDRRPEALITHIEALPSRRLGQRFEAFWHFFLDSDERYQLLATNLPVREAGRTVGEFDIIVAEGHTGLTWHLELAVKFYLGVYRDGSGPSAWDLWWGPSRHDRLDLKLGPVNTNSMSLLEAIFSSSKAEGVQCSGPT